eukprot:scaffold248733_cov23-Tisochrysis_lutea.AAC.1
MSSKAQEVVVSRGKVLELLRPNEMGKLVTVVSTEVFGCIRALAPFRITGASTDYVIVGSDSGRGLGRSLTHVGTCSWGLDRAPSSCDQASMYVHSCTANVHPHSKTQLVQAHSIGRPSPCA